MKANAKRRRICLLDKKKGDFKFVRVFCALKLIAVEGLYVRFFSGCYVALRVLFPHFFHEKKNLVSLRIL